MCFIFIRTDYARSVHGVLASYPDIHKRINSDQPKADVLAQVRNDVATGNFTRFFELWHGILFVFWDCNKMQMYISCICDYDRNWEVFYLFSICDVGGSSSQSKSFTENKEIKSPLRPTFPKRSKALSSENYVKNKGARILFEIHLLF